MAHNGQKYLLWAQEKQNTFLCFFRYSREDSFQVWVVVISVFNLTHKAIKQKYLQFPRK